jgi:Tol biopolymer transport system component
MAKIHIRNIGIGLLAFVILSSIALSQFGQNKVQYRKFDWKYIQSPNFDVYYYDTKYLAEETAHWAEEALVSIQKTLNYKINKRISLIIYKSHNEFQQTNVIYQYMPEGVGGVTELMKNRVVLPFEGKQYQFKHVIHHELVHAVLNDMFYGGTLQSALSSGQRIEFPLWMNEGLAEYESIGDMNTQTDMFMRDVSLSDYLVGLERLNGYYAYRGGQTFYWYVAEKYGQEKVGDLINKLRVYGTVDNAFKSAFKMSFEDFSEQWVKDMKKLYWPDIDKYKDPEDFADRITEHKKDRSFYNSSPAISPDGEKMAYISALGGEFGIYISELKSGKERKFSKIISSNRDQDFEELNMLTPGISWSPDGKSLAISAKAGGTDAIYIVDVQTEDYKKLELELPSIASVKWSPNGKYLAFTATDRLSSDLFVYDIATKDLKRLTNDVFTDIVPEWAPDSKLLYFISDRGDEIDGNIGKEYKIWNHDVKQSDIFTIDIETKSIKRITYTPQFEKTTLAVNSDATKLFFVSDENGIGNLYMLDLKTGIYKPKTNSLNGLFQISLAADDSKLLFSTQIDAGYDIFLINFPIDKPFIDSLPFTEFRKKETDKLKLISSQSVSNQDENSTAKSEDLTGYDNFSIEFSRQQVVKPNPDAEKKENHGDTAAVAGYDLTDTTLKEKSYKIKFSPDLVLGNPGYSTYFGVQGVAQMLFSDVMGDHQIYFLANLLYDLRNSNFYLAYSYLPNLIDYQVSLYHSAGYVRRSDGYLYRFRDWGGSVSALYPFDKFRRMEFDLNFKNLSRENLNFPKEPSVGKFLIVPTVKYVYDNVSYGFFAPIDGSRYNIDIKGAPPLSGDSSGFITVKFDYRKYFRIGDWMSLAFRGSAGKSFGNKPQRFFLGGTENWFNRSFKNNYLPFDEPEDFAFMEFIMPMRGVSVNERNGSQFFLANAEFRFPLIYAFFPTAIPLVFQSMMGAVFVDAGGAWNGDISDFTAARMNLSEKSVPKDLLLSAGFGLRSYVMGLPLKLDVAWQYLYWNWTKPMYMVSLGYDF